MTPKIYTNDCLKIIILSGDSVIDKLAGMGNFDNFLYAALAGYFYNR